MDKQQLTYLVFGAVIVLALIFDLGLLSKKNKIQIIVRDKYVDGYERYGS